MKRHTLPRFIAIHRFRLELRRRTFNLKTYGLKYFMYNQRPHQLPITNHCASFLVFTPTKISAVLVDIRLFYSGDDLQLIHVGKMTFVLSDHFADA